MFEPDFQSLHDGFRIKLVDKLGVVPFERFNEALDHPIASRTFHRRCDGLESQLPRKLAGVRRRVTRAVYCVVCKTAAVPYGSACVPPHTLAANSKDIVPTLAMIKAAISKTTN